MINDADIETMKEMRRKGATYRAIGEKWNIDRRRTHWLIGSIKPDPSTLIVTDPLAGLINRSQTSMPPTSVVKSPNGDNVTA